MRPFPLKIVTPEGLAFEGQAETVTLRSATGQMGILAGHTDCVTPVVPGPAVIMVDGKRNPADCGRGILRIADGSATLAVEIFRWQGKSDTATAGC